MVGFGNAHFSGRTPISTFRFISPVTSQSCQPAEETARSGIQKLATGGQTLLVAPRPFRQFAADSTLGPEATFR